MGRARRRGPHHARRPHGPDDHPGQERAPPPARSRARPRRRAPVHLRRWLQRRRPCRRAGRMPRPYPGPARRRQRLLLPTRCAWPGKNGRPADRGIAVHCLEPEDFEAAAAGAGPRGRKKPLTPNPEPDEALTLPGTPLYGTVRAEAWHRVTPSSTATAAGSKDARTCPSCAAPSSTSPSSACPTAATRTAPCGCGTPARPAVPRQLWRAYLASFDTSTPSSSSGSPRPHRRQGPRSRAGRPLGPAPHGGARPAPACPALAADLRWSWGNGPTPSGRSPRESAAGFEHPP